MADRIPLYVYKGGRCEHCSRSVEEAVAQFGSPKRLFHFHHVDPSKKAPNYNNLIRRTISTEQLDEVDKCVLLCAFCHGLVESVGEECEIKLTRTVEDQTSTQVLRGQVVQNLLTGNLAFLTNEEFRLNPYLLQIGSNQPTLVFGNELYSSVLMDHIRRIRQIEQISITEHGGKQELFRATLVDGDRCKFEVDVRFPHLQIEIPDVAWIRHGIAVMKDGTLSTNGRLSCICPLGEAF